MRTIVLLVGFSSFLNIPCSNASVLEGWRLLLLKYSSVIFPEEPMGGCYGNLPQHKCLTFRPLWQHLD